MRPLLFNLPEPAAGGELIVDYFAGGGGASEGIRLALGRDPDLAVNHDVQALAMHRRNHPATRHLAEDVWSVDPVGACGGRPVGLFWMSPDCKHFSKAKGGKPREKLIRGLAWVGLRFVHSLPKRQRPRIVVLENVEEFQDWGPLTDDGRPCAAQKGATFRQFNAAFEALGYRTDWRELRAWRYGAPTIRKRLFWIARRDGRPIVWPEPTHGNPNDPADAALIAAGKLKPWRTAAEIIDWSLALPVDLRDLRMARIAKGTMRYVVNSARPFIVRTDMTSAFRRNGVNGVDQPLRTQTTAGSHALVSPHLVRTAHGEADKAGKRRGQGQHSLDEPLATVLASNDLALSAPFVTKFRNNSIGHAAAEPLHTITAHASATHPGAAPLGIVAPVLVGCGGRAGQTDPKTVDAPLQTQTAKPDLCVAAPFLVPRYQERPGQEPRTRPVELPAATVVPGGNEGVLVAPHLMVMRNAAKPFNEGDRPVHTITAGGAHPHLVAAFLAQHNSARDGDRINPGRDADAPVATILGAGGQQGLVAAHLSHSYTSNTRGGEGDPEKPLKTVLAGGNHAATVYAFLAKYYGAGEPSQAADAPLSTITAKPRHGLVTVTIEGEPYVIVDIGMRMLTPRERFNAQGFRPDYQIAGGILADGSPVAFTLEAQGRMCGNSVCPPLAAAIVAANYAEALAAAESDAA